MKKAGLGRRVPEHLVLQRARLHVGSQALGWRVWGSARGGRQGPELSDPPLLRKLGGVLKQQGWREAGLQPLRGRGAPGSHGACVGRHHLASACLAADPVALCVAAAAEEAAAAAAAAAVAAVLALAPAVNAAAAAAAAGGTLTVTLVLPVCLACLLFLMGPASPARPGALRGRPAAYQTPLAAFQEPPVPVQPPLSAFFRPAADGFAALLAAWAPCWLTAFCGIFAAGPCLVGLDLFCQQPQAGQQMSLKVQGLAPHWELGWCECSVVL